MIYLDFNATAIPDEAVLKEALNKYLEFYANSSGLSLFSQKCFRLVNECRKKIASCFGLKENQVIFTSSATEANQIFITTLWKKNLELKKPFYPLLSKLEHPSIVELVQKLPFTEPLWYKLSKKGELAEPELKEKIKKADCAIMMAAHNESGLILPLKEFISLIYELRQADIPLLCDASQVLRHISFSSPFKPNFFCENYPIPVFFSLASHKIGAGMGCGLLIRPKGLWGNFFENNTLFVGGNQEFQIRSGTHNLQAIYAMALKIEKIFQNFEDYERLKKLTERFEEKLKFFLKDILTIEIIGSEGERLAGTSLILFPAVAIDFFLMALDKEEIFVSTGTSCKSRSRTASPGLLSLGYSEEEALSVIRFSYGVEFSETIQDNTIFKIKRILEKIV